MKKLKKAELNKLYGYYDSDEKRAILGNGQTGYYKPRKILIVCCGNCGDYTWVKIEKGLK